MSEPAVGFQYADRRHEAETAVSGMWLFLATEILFFGVLICVYLVYRNWYPADFEAAVARTNLTIGSANTFVLLTSSLTLSLGLSAISEGRVRALKLWCLATIALGLLFLALKGFEYADDLDKHLLPGRGFPVGGESGGHMQLFFLFYWTATGFHAVHMMIGIALIIVLILRASQFSRNYFTPVEVTALYWSFVDMVWIFLYPLIYLAGRTQ